jgi:hypothetical protein
MSADIDPDDLIARIEANIFERRPVREEIRALINIIRELQAANLSLAFRLEAALVARDVGAAPGPGRTFTPWRMP